MVQEITTMETPSPQTVGLHFVHQYYTMLNKSPDCLHRFYSNSSQFLRGGLDSAGNTETTVQGQQEIHDKVMELNFRDCHTKIIMVDSQITLGGGVVIQVSGELSNDGQPLRRFMQTFVLAFQSPKQYYVINDILRYQDDVFSSDDENDFQEGETEGEDVHADVNDATGTIQEASLSHYYAQHSLNNGTAHAHLEKTPVMIPATVPAAVVPASVPLPISVVHPMVVAPHPIVVSAPVAVAPIVPMAPLVAVTATAAASVQAVAPSAVVVVQQQQQQQHKQLPVVDEPEPIVNNNNNNVLTTAAAATATTNTNTNNIAVVEDPEYVPPVKEFCNTEKAPSKSPEFLDNNLIETSANEPRTYATIASRKTAPSGTSPNSNSSIGAPAKVAPGVPTMQPSTRPDLRSTDAYSNSFVPPQPQRPPPPRSKPLTMRGGPSGGNSNYSMSPRDRVSNSRGASEEPVEYERNRVTGPMYPDSQQVFVGNLPLDMNEDELKAVFSKYGTVVDVRIQNKYSGFKTGPPGRQTPNYGFVSFDSVTPVKQLLNEKQNIFCRSNQRLNVEEKKVNRPRPIYGDSRPGVPRMGGPGGGGGGGTNSNRGPPMGGGGRGRGGMMMGGMNRGGNGMGGGGSGRGGYSSQGPNRDRRQ